MVLLENIFLTSGSLKHSYNRGGLPKDDNFDIFKYSIASIAGIYPFSQIILNIKLDDCYKSREQELKNWIDNLFPNKTNFTLNIGYRCEYQNQWKELIESFKDELIFFSCNHDHIFIDSQPYYFQWCVETFEKYKNEVGILAISHFPDYIPLCKSREYKFDGPGFVSNTCDTGSFNIVTKSLLKKWFCEVELGNAFIPRSDWEGQLIGNNVKDCVFFTPCRELFRHYDGYSNLAAPTSYHMEHYPPLIIPKGFFEGGIEVDAEQDLLRELPMFWASRISKVLNKEKDKENIEKRLQKLHNTLTFYLGDSKERDYFFERNKVFIEALYGKHRSFRLLDNLQG